MTGPHDPFHRLFPEARKNKLKTDLISTFPLPRDNINDKMERWKIERHLLDVVDCFCPTNPKKGPVLNRRERCIWRSHLPFATPDWPRHSRLMLMNHLLKMKWSDSKLLRDMAKKNKAPFHLHVCPRGQKNEESLYSHVDVFKKRQKKLYEISLTTMNCRVLSSQNDLT